MNPKIILYGGILIFAIVAGYFCITRPQTPAAVTNYPSQGTDIIAFGDSLIVGTGSTEGNDFVTLVSKKIAQPIIRLGVVGDTTSQGMARLQDLDQYHPKAVILLLGGNDFIHKTDPKETYQNLATIIENIQKRGAIVLLLGVRSAALSDPFKSKYEQLARTYHTGYVPDVLSGLFGDSRYMSDEVHPNDAGYAKIADRVYTALLPLLQ